MKRSRRILALGLLLTLLLVSSAGTSLVLAQDGTSQASRASSALAAPAAGDLRAAWERARQAGSYRFSADVDETLTPRAIPENIGEQGTRVALQYQGAVQPSGRAYVELRGQAGAQQVTPLVMVLDHGLTFLLQDNVLIPADDPLGLSATNMDLLGYLAGATNVTRLDPVTVDGQTLTRYAFDVDGARLAAYISDLQEAMLRSEPGVPADLSVDPSPIFAAATGKGELWVGNDGLPVRQSLELTLPEINGAYGAHLQMVASLSDYGQVGNLPQAQQQSDGSWRMVGAAPSWQASAGEPAALASATVAEAAAQAVQTAPDAPGHAAVQVPASELALFTLVLLVLLVVRWYRQQRRAATTAIVSFLVFLMAFSPLLQSGQIVSFMERQAQAATARAATAGKIVAALGLAGQANAQAPTTGAEPAPTATLANGLATVPAERATGASTALAAERMVRPVRSQQLASGSDASIARCGEGTPGVDTDHDGLSDQVENCLGTDPNNTDSDNDGLSDSVEVNGFDLGGKHWSTNPLAVDSSGDGLMDLVKWAAPTGLAPSQDVDGDNIPNIWDSDLDADGVPNSLDLSPFAVSDYLSTLSLSTQAAAADGYEYIDFQVQPQNPAHLSYPNAALTWPHDEAGNIQNVNSTVGGVRLLPFLRITSDVAPSADLATRYGFKVWASGSTYTILVPLAPVQDAGVTYAFYGKVVFGPGPLPDVTATAKLIWLVDGQVVNYVNCNGAAGCQPNSQHTVLTQYEDTFRLTALQVSRSKGYEIMALGTPGTPAEDRSLFQLLLGLNETFLQYESLQLQQPSQTALQQLDVRFSQTGTPVTYTFGIDPHNVAVVHPVQYGHSDEGLGRFASEQLPAYLDANYTASPCHDAAGNAIRCASVVLAFEATEGTLDLRDLPAAGTNQALRTISAGVNVNVGAISLATMRGARLAMYEDTAARGWQQMTAARMLEIVDQRYHDQYATALRTLYPSLDSNDLRYLNVMAYLWATAGMTTVIRNGAVVVKPGTSDEIQTLQDLSVSADLEAQLSSALAYSAQKSGFAAFADKVKPMMKSSIAEVVVGGKAIWAGWQAYQHPPQTRTGRWSAGCAAGIGIAAGAAGTVLTGFGLACAADPTLAGCGNEEAFKVANTVVQVVTVVAQAAAIINMGVQYANNALQAFSKTGKVLGAIGLVIGIGATWASFGLMASHSPDPVSLRVGLGLAIVTTVWLVFLFAINFVPVVGQIISAILSMIDTILSLATGGEWSVSRVLLNIFYDAAALTELGTTEFGTFSVALRDASLGLAVGNSMYMQAPFNGTMTKTGDGDDGDLWSSQVQGKLVPIAEAGSLTGTEMTGARTCTVVNGVLQCHNLAKVGFALAPAVNGLMAFQAQVYYEYRWAEYGLFHAWRWSTNTEGQTVPEASRRQTNRMYIDILPATLDALWSWSSLTKTDQDGDGLADTREAVLGTNPALVDTDGDGVGDNYEFEHGYSPTSRDTDGDGLPDGLELCLGTDPKNAQTAGDGMSDGAKVFHQQADGTWAGGWSVSVPGGASYWMYPDPMVANPSGDGLSYNMKKANHLSPYAYNSDTPFVALRGEPIVGQPGGKGGVFVEPGDTVKVTLGLLNTSQKPVTTTLSLCLPPFLSLASGGQMQGDRAPATQTGTCAGGTSYAWAFGGTTTLQVYESVSTTLTLNVNASGSVTGTVQATLPFGNKTLVESLVVHVDNDNPSVSLAAPAADAIVSGASYVVGGMASDPSSWVSSVEFGYGMQAQGVGAFYPATGTGVWAYGWNLAGVPDGHYVLQARAHDALGHTGLSPAVNILVDNTAPSASLSVSSVISGTAQQVHLAGTATDNLSGVARVQVSADGQPWRSVTLASPNAVGTGWSWDWPLSLDAQGTHEVKVRAIDRAGNVGPASSQDVVVDRVPPAAAITGGAAVDMPPAVAVGQALTLTGVADEGGNLPSPATPADLRQGMAVLTDTTVWLGLSTVNDANEGVRVAWLGDANADRLADLAVGLPAAEGGRGRIAVFFGKAGGWATPPSVEMLASSPTRLLGEPAAGLGKLLAAAGDADGDGYADLLAGEDSSTRAFLVFGKPSPVGELTLAGGLANYLAVLQTPAAITGLASAGDVNGDGLADLLITAGGSTYLLLGRTSPWPLTVDVAAQATAVIPSTTGAAGLGDVNGDSLADLAALASGKAALFLGTTGLTAGAQTQWPLAEAHTTFTSADSAPRVAALGDVNGDGKADWLLSSAGTPLLVLGNASAPVSPASWTTQSFAGYDGLLAAPGDVNGDGYDDVLLGNAAHVASLLVGRSGSSLATTPLATVSGVAASASAPYASGADVNADGSSDLLLVPDAAAAAEKGFAAISASMGFVSPEALPRAAASSNGPGARPGGAQAAVAPALMYVDADGQCGNNTPCYTTITAAVAAADNSGVTITVYPGVYAPFSVSGHTKDNLRILGVGPDAVFVDGGGSGDAVTLSTVNGVRLSGLTVRNAANGIVLSNAGAAGYEAQIDHLVAQACAHGISADRNSLINLADSTLVSDGAANHAIVNLGPQTSSGYQWTQRTSVPAVLGAGGGLVATGSRVYGLPANGSGSVYEFEPGTNSWSLRTTAPAALYSSSVAANTGDNLHVVYSSYTPDVAAANGTIIAMVMASDGKVYAGGSFTQIGGISASNIALWTGSAWQSLGAGVNGAVRGLALSSAGDLYVAGDFTTAGGNPASHVAKYGTGGWAALGTGMTGGVTCNAVAVSGTTVYVGGQFWNMGGVEANNMAAWNGTVWSGLISHDSTANGVDGPVYAVAAMTSGEIFVGGNFHNAGTLRADYVARWYPSNLWWAYMTYDSMSGSYGTSGPVYAIAATSDGKAFFGGAFGSIIGQSARNCAYYGPYPDLGFTPLGTNTGTDGAVTAVTAVGTSGVYFAGNFTNAYRWNGTYVTGNGLILYNRGGGGWGAPGPDDFHSSTAVAADASGTVYLAYGGGKVARWSTAYQHQRYDRAANTWTAKAALPSYLYDGASAASDASGNVYVMPGGTSNTLYYYSDTGDTWTQKASLPGSLAGSGALAWGNGYLYAVRALAGGGYGLYRYDPAGNAWTTLSVPTAYQSLLGSGVAMAYDGYGCLYVLAGKGSRNMLRYRIATGDWLQFPNPGVGFVASTGHGLAAVGGYLYVYAAPDQEITNCFRYGAVGAVTTSFAINRTAFVAPLGTSGPLWSNLSSAVGTPDYTMAPATDCAWVADTSWAPTLPTGAASLSLSQAAFVAAQQGVYRVGAASSLTAGYHHYKAEAHVYPTQAACDRCVAGDLTWGSSAFGSIPEAVASGAARVYIHPGVYTQPFYLVSGVQVYGYGADVTVIQPPASGAGSVVKARGVAGATLAKVTLAGNGSWTGLLADGGAKGIVLTRAIVRDCDTGVRVTGNTTAVQVLNADLVRNQNGMVVEGSAPVNVRNNIFAYNTATGLTYGTPSSLANTYNDYWANGTAMSPVDAGGGKIYLDPLFADIVANNFHLAAGSPAVGAGSPTDPVPPASGARIDIGYMQAAGAGVYADLRYSATGLNDGLTWGVDAFDSIQDAVDAAHAILTGLDGAVPAGGYTVGVGVGTYNERVTLPSYVHLVGSGADRTTIAAGGTGSPVTISGAVQAGVEGLKLTGAGTGGAGAVVTGGSSGVTLVRNVIAANPVGVRLESSSSGALSFNTIAANTAEGVLVQGAGAWAGVQDNVVAGNATGLRVSSGGLIRNRFNLLYNTTDLDGVTAGEGTVTADPAFAAGDKYYLTISSPAVDAADPQAAVPTGGGLRADLGYKELVASPLTLLFGPQISSRVTGNSGVAQVQVGVVRVADVSQPVTATLPGAWTTVTAGGQPVYLWSSTTTPSSAGVYRVYARAQDNAGNQPGSTGWYAGSFVADSVAPSVSWVTAPPASTGEAAVHVAASASDYVDAGDGARFSIREVRFEVTAGGQTVSYPAAWADGPWNEAQQQARTFGAWLPLPTGAASIQAVAVDEAGNVTRSAARSVSVSGSTHVVTITSPVKTRTNETAVSLAGYVRFASAGGAGSVQVSVDGGGAVEATLADVNALVTSWRAAVTISTAASHTITVTPVRGTAGTAASLSLSYSTTAPTLDVVSPAAGTVVTRTVSLAGTVGSTLDPVKVEVSMDGGTTWRMATLSGSSPSWTWALSWSLPAPLQDFVTYPLQLRATDDAGNTATISRPVTVDNTPPAGLNPVTFAAPAGQHVQVGDTVDVSWSALVDGCGAAQVLLAADGSATTVPTQVVSGSSATVTLSSLGTWYIHLAAVDTAGNQAVYHYGPWYVGDTTNPTFSSRRESIVVDGAIDLDHNEWNDTQLLGSDARSGVPQKLYATWDGQAIYLGWRGAWWTLDGILWAYLDLNPALGTTATVDGSIVLPFPADLAVQISGPATGTLWRYTAGSGWATYTGGLQFAQGTAGDTEARIPWTVAADADLRLVALAMPRTDYVVTTLVVPSPGSSIGEDGTTKVVTTKGGRAAETGGSPWAVFPPVNPLDTSVETGYGWQQVGSNNPSNDSQPQTRTAFMTVTSPQAGAARWCPGATLQYVIELRNPEDTELAGLLLDLATTAGLSLQSQSGATCLSCTSATHWTLAAPAIPAGGTSTVTVNAQLASDLGAVTAVTNTVTLDGAGNLALAGGAQTQALAHLVAGQAPAATIDAGASPAIHAGAQTITGSASGSGGIVQVQVRKAGGAWQTALGTSSWSAGFIVPSSATEITFEAQAVDGCGRTSPLASRTFAVDGVAPQLSYSVASVLTSTVPLLTGTTADPFPSGALVPRVEVQVDSETGPWLAALGPFAPSGGLQGWTWPWDAVAEDGVAHRLRSRATDAVGNVTVGDWYPTVVDNVAPVVNVTTRLETVVVADYVLAGVDIAPAPAASGVRGVFAGEPQTDARALAGSPVLAGTVTDGVGVREVRVLLYTPDSQVVRTVVPVVGSSWQYTPALSPSYAGVCTLRIEVEDVNGNMRLYGPYDLQVLDQEIASLQAANNGPTQRFKPTTLSATVTAGTNVRYLWDFGDGTTGEGKTVSHVYPAVGSYVAQLTAVNTRGSFAASTSVTIVQPTGVLAFSTQSSTTCPGWNPVFDIAFTNDLPVPMTNVRLTVRMPSQTEADTAHSTPGLTVSPSGSQATWNVGTLGAGQTAVRHLVLHFYSTIPNGTSVIVQVVSTATDCAAVTRSVIMTVRTGSECNGTTPTPTVTGTPPTATPTVTGTPATSTPTPDATVTPTPEGTPTPTIVPGDLVLHGTVREHVLGAQGLDAGRPLAGAHIVLVPCYDADREAVTDALGQYTLVVPAGELALCTEIVIDVSAPGYQAQRQTYAIADLYAQPQRDWTLHRAFGVWLPVAFR